MMKKTLMILLIVTGMGTTLAIAADPDEQAPERLPRVLLMDVLDAVAKNSDLVFVVDERAPADIVIGQQSLRRIGFPELHVILKNNGLAAARAQGLVNVVPVNGVRQHAIPIVDVNDESTSDDEWVTVIVEVRHMPADHLVPILRPLLPQAGHLAASPLSDMIIVVDRFANARRVAQIVAKLDTPNAASAQAD